MWLGWTCSSARSLSWLPTLPNLFGEGCQRGWVRRDRPRALYLGSPLSQTCLGRGAGGEGPSMLVRIIGQDEFKFSTEATVV